MEATRKRTKPVAVAQRVAAGEQQHTAQGERALRGWVRILWGAWGKGPVFQSLLFVLLLGLDEGGEQGAGGCLVFDGVEQGEGGG